MNVISTDFTLLKCISPSVNVDALRTYSVCSTRHSRAELCLGAASGCPTLSSPAPAYCPQRKRSEESANGKMCGRLTLYQACNILMVLMLLYIYIRMRFSYVKKGVPTINWHYCYYVLLLCITLSWQGLYLLLGVAKVRFFQVIHIGLDLFNIMGDMFICFPA